MSKKAARGLAALRGIFAKAADMAPDEDDTDEEGLEEALEDDFQDYDESVEASGEEGEEEGEDEEGEDDEEVAQGQTTVAKADAMQPTDATPLLQELVEVLQELRDQNAVIAKAQGDMLKQNALIAKGFMGMLDEQETVAKSVVTLQNVVDNAPRLPKSARNKPKRPEPKQPQINAGEIIAKAASSVDHFSSREVSKLESMLQAGNVQGVYAQFAPEQLEAVGLPVKN